MKWTLWKAQPTAIIAVVRAAIYLAVLFGADLSEAQTAGVIAFVETVLAALNWSQVTPNAKVVTTTSI